MKFCSPEHNPYKVESLQGFFLKKKKSLELSQRDSIICNLIGTWRMFSISFRNTVRKRKKSK